MSHQNHCRLLKLLPVLLVALAVTRASKRVKRQHNLYSVNDFLGQLGQLAALSQPQGGGGGPSNYLAGLLQGYQQQQQFGQYQSGYQQRPPPRPVPPEYLQDLQYQQQQQQGQGVLGYDPVNGGFGYQPGSLGGGGGASGGGVLAGPGGLGGALGGLGGLGGALGGLGGLAGLAGLGGLGGAGGGGGSGGYRPQGAYPYPRPPPGAVPLANALQSVARYDDLQCVPRLLCELTAGGRPGSAKQNAALPFVNRDTLVSLLTVLNFGTNSPLIVFGRAALLGYMAQGDAGSCHSAYPTCPRDPDRLVDYLNNHNGGFFRFFTGVANPQYQQQQQYQNYQQYQQYQQQLQYQGYRPGAAPYAPQYRDYEDTRSPPTRTASSSKPLVFPEAKSLQPDAESRILTKVHPIEAADGSRYVPDDSGSHFLPTPRPPESSSGIRGGRKQKFSTAPYDAYNTVPTGELPLSGTTVYVNGQHVPLRQYLQSGQATFTLGDAEYTFSNPYAVKTTAGGHRVRGFSSSAVRVGSPDEINRDNREYAQAPYIPSNLPLHKPAVPVEIFPTRTGTGDLRLDPADHFKLLSSAAQGGGRPQGKPFRFANDAEAGQQQSDGGPYREYYAGANREGNAFRFPHQESFGR